MNTSTLTIGRVKLNFNYNEIFAEEISDECAYHLTQYFKNIAFAFEALHLFQIARHKASLPSDATDRKSVV